MSHLALVSSSAGIADPLERRLRTETDAALARRIETVGLDAFLDEWLESPMVAVTGVDHTRRAADRRRRSENTAAGLAAALRGMGQGAQPPFTDRLDELTIPVLVMCGEEDRRYVAIATDMAGRITGARLVVVPGRGHNLVLEDPSAVAAAVAALLDDPSQG